MEGGGNDSMVDSLGVMIRIGNITGAPKRRARLSLWLRSIDDGCNSENDDDMNNVVMEDDVNDGENSNDDDTDDFNDDNQDKVIEAEAQLQPPTVVNQSLPPISSFHALNTANLTLVLSPFPIVHAFLSFRRRLIRKLLFNPFHNTHSFPSLSSSHFDHDDTFVMSLERNLTRLLFRPSPVVSALARSRIPEENTGQGFVSVHVRTGDDVHEEKQRRMKLILRNMSVNAERMLDCAGEVHPFGKRTVFLASDSMGFKQVFMQQASKRGVNVYTQNIRPSVHLKNYGGSSQHSTSLFRFPFRFFPSSSSSSAESSVDVDRKCMQFLDVFADAIALGYGSGMVARLSSFASAALALGDTKRAVQIYLGLGQKQGECDVEQLAREERRVREAENTGRRGTKRRVKRDASMLHVLWYEDEDKRRIGRIGNRMQYVGHGNHVGLYAAEVFNMTSA